MVWRSGWSSISMGLGFTGWLAAFCECSSKRREGEILYLGACREAGGWSLEIDRCRVPHMSLYCTCTVSVALV